MSEVQVIATEGNYRAVIERDDYAYGEAPDGDWQAGVIRLDYSGYYKADAKTEAAGDFEEPAKRFMEYYGMRKGIGVVERFLRIFHGARDVRTFHYSYSPDSAVYLAFDSAAMRKTWGCAEDLENGAEATATEWQAYIDGDVYGVRVERLVKVSSVTTFDGEEVDTEEAEDWETVDDSVLWGLYGEEYAKEVALDQLAMYGE